MDYENDIEASSPEEHDVEGDDLSEFDDDQTDVENGIYDEPWDGFRNDAEADSDVLASAGHGMDEDYGYYGGESFYDPCPISDD